MRPLRDIPIRRKLTVMIVLTSAIALLLGGAASLSYELARYRRAIIRDLSTQADIIGENSAAALAFRDQNAAHETLSALHARREIVFACLYSSDGKVFAEYDPYHLVTPPRPEPPGHRFDGGHLFMFRQIKLGDDTVGSICLRADLHDERARLTSYAAIALVVMLAALFAALIISNRLQRVVSDPIQALGRVTRAVSEQKDYSLRAVKHGEDEIGALTDGFNQMLEQIQKRGDELIKSKEELDRFFTLSLDMLCIAGFDGYFKRLNPAWADTLGFTMDELLAEPFLHFVHPDDRERTIAEAGKLAAGDQTISFENRYRCKDGSYKWLLWNAAPLPGQQLIYAAARDITERRRLEKQVLEISDREQARIGQDLHDDLCQQLISIAFAVNLLEKDLREKSIAEAARAGEIARLLDDATTHARTLARGLYPVKLEAEGLTAGLQELAANIAGRFQIECRLDCPNPVIVSDLAVATHLYRIAQEAVANAVRHARASRIIIRLETTDSHLALSVIDDGIGLPVATGERRGMGLQTMRYRTNIIGARLEIKCGNAGGTEVCCTVPLRPS